MERMESKSLRSLRMRGGDLCWVLRRERIWRSLPKGDQLEGCKGTRGGKERNRAMSAIDLRTWSLGLEAKNGCCIPRRSLALHGNWVRINRFDGEDSKCLRELPLDEDILQQHNLQNATASNSTCEALPLRSFRLLLILQVRVKELYFRHHFCRHV